MKINTYFIQLASTIIVIFGGTFTIRYFRAGELLLDQLIGAMVGILLLMATILRMRNHLDLKMVSFFTSKINEAHTLLA